MKPITRKEKFIAGEKLTPITREEMFLQKYGGNGGGGADWNASEGEAGYVKNRTHYIEAGEVSVECAAEDEGTILEGFPAFAVDDTITVKVDGVEYSLVAFFDSNAGSAAVGDSFDDVDDGTGEYGWIIYKFESATIFFSYSDHTVSWKGEIVHTLDRKYLPNVPVMVDGKVPASQVESDVFYVDFVNDSAGNYTCSKTKKEIVIENHAGKLVVGRLKTSGGFYNLLLHGAGASFLSFSGYVCDYLADAHVGHNVVVQYDGTTVNVYKT